MLWGTYYSLLWLSGPVSVQPLLSLFKKQGVLRNVLNLPNRNEAVTHFTKHKAKTIHPWVPQTHQMLLGASAARQKPPKKSGYYNSDQKAGRAAASRNLK